MVDNVNGINSLGGANPSKRINKKFHMPKQAEARGTDSVQVSSKVKNMQAASATEKARLEKIMSVKKALADGTYITGEKLDKALDSAIDEAYGIKEKENLD